MRPRLHVLVLVIGAAAVLLVSAPALGAAWLSPELPASSAAQIEHSPAIAVDPGTARAAVVADDGLVAPPPHTAAASTADWSTAWSGPTTRPHSAGQADVAWACRSQSHAVELGSNAAVLCNSQSGIFFIDNGGTS